MTIRFIPAVKLAFRRLKDIEGRSSRAEFWWYVLFYMGLNSIMSVLFEGGPGFILGAVASLIVMITALTLIAVALRRLHDTGRSGWWLLLGLIPVIGHFILLVWFCQKGEGDNEYGDNPLDEGFKVEVVD